MNEKSYLPVSRDLYSVAYFICDDIRGKNKARRFRNVHPEWDCQPWSEGWLNPDTYVGLVIKRGDELTTSHTIHRGLLAATLWEIYPGVAPYPKKK